jgi:uncharacterized protein (DUF1501 family)
MTPDRRSAPPDDGHALDHDCAVHGMRALDRRSFLHMTVGGALGMLLRPGLPELLAGNPADLASEKSVILLWLHGGMSQIDSVDPKYDSRFAGPFKQIRTNVPGVHFTEHVPQLARQMHRMAVVRSVKSPENEHNRAQFFANTGYRAVGTLDNPSLGSMISHELGPRPMLRTDREGLPPFISIGHEGWGPGLLGVEHSPFIVWNPSAPPDNLGMARNVDDGRFNRRLAMLQAFEEGSPVTGETRFAKNRSLGRQGARRFMTSTKVSAFNLEGEPPLLRDAYGRTPFGQGCLLARRLVEAGVRFVQVHQGGWDSHADNFNIHERLFGILDPAMSTLLNDLHDRGMMDNTLVICMGEFGRTPRINRDIGRDHHPHAWSVMLAGGGIAGGQVYGETDRGGMEVTDKQVTIPDLFATFCHLLQVDAHKEFIAAGGRPIRLVDDGEVIPELFGGQPAAPATPVAKT